ncbi:MAG TPA: hypothetical protein VGC84_13535, partial [Ilumatobacteraceae bacterium]
MNRRRTIVGVVAIVLVAIAVAGIVIARRDSDDEIVAGTRATTIAPTITTSTTTTPATPVTTATSVVAKDPIVAQINLADVVSRLEPTEIVAFPITPPGDLQPTAYATIASGNRIVILDDVSGVIRFVDGATRMDITQYAIDVPTIGSQSFVSRDVLVGPDDIVYVNEGDAAGKYAVVAYGRTGDSYVEV